MKRLKKIFSVAFATLLCVTICVGCQHQSMDDVAPETYGAWDGYYVYRGNGKCKTTCEDYEQLVTTVEIEEISYSVTECVDCKIVDETMYMILSCELPSDETDVETGDEPLEMIDSKGYVPKAEQCLVRYDIKTKSCALIASDFYEGNQKCRLSMIEQVFDDRLLVQVASRRWWIIGFDGEIIQKDVEMPKSWEWVSDEYLVEYEFVNYENLMYYKKGHFSERTLVGEYGKNDSFSYVEKDGQKGLVFKESDTICFFNFATNVMSAPISFGKKAEFYENYGFVKTYESTKIVCGVTIFGEDEAIVEKNNAVYEIIYEPNGIRLELFFDLTEKCRTLIGGIGKDKIAYREETFQEITGCAIGGGNKKYYVYDCSTRKKKEIEKEKYETLSEQYSSFYEKENGIEVGEYIYFQHTEKISAYMASTTLAYFLKRYHVETGEVETMQLFHEDSSRSEDRWRFCYDLWFSYRRNGSWEFDFSEFVVCEY